MLKPVSLVLSSGGARGIAHIGVIETFEKFGFTIESVAGTSMGALVGGFYASGNLSLLKDRLCSLTFKEMIRLVDLNLGLDGLIKGKKVFREIEEMIPDRNIEDLSIPFVAVSTDIIHGKEIVHNKGSLIQAIRGSISIPSVFKPLPSAGTYLIDGGILNPLPVDYIKRKDHDILVTVNVGAFHTQHENLTEHPEIVRDEPAAKTENSETEPPKPNYLYLAQKSIALMLNRISELTIEKYKPDIVIDLEHDAFGLYEFHRAQEIIEYGRKSAEIKIREYLNRET